MSQTAYQKLKDLIEFQDIDLETTAKETRLSQIPGEIEQLESRIQEFKADLDKVIQIIQDQDKSRRSKERQLESNTEQFQKYQTQLYALKSNKDYQAMLQEIENLKEKNGRIEEEILIMMEEAETLKSRQSQAEAVCKSKTAEMRKQIQEKEREQQELQHRITVLREMRDKKKVSLDSRLLTVYEKLRRNLGPGRVVVPVRDETCSGCHIALRPQYHYEIKMTEGVFNCENCHRILFFADVLKANT
jgi:predicted  nucleic acid-binding Zn-ribbon protein